MDLSLLNQTASVVDSKGYIYYTESRTVNLYVGGSTPSVKTDNAARLDKDMVQMEGYQVYALWPQTAVSSDTNLDLYDVVSQPFVKVKVLSTPVMEGWILRKFLRKCLKKATPSQLTGQKFTGVTYGDYKFNSDAVSGADMHFVKGICCNVCGFPRSEHRVYETDEARDFVRQLAKHQAGDRDLAKNIMVGALFVYSFLDSNKPILILVASSGFPKKDAGLALTVKKYYGSDPRVRYADWNELAGRDYLNCLGKTASIPSGQKTVTQIGKGDVSMDCAAPKLVQYFLHFIMPDISVCHILYLSETYVVGDVQSAPTQGIVTPPTHKPGKTIEGVGTPVEASPLYPYGTTAESCNRCRKSIPPMLCGYLNFDKTSHRSRSSVD